MKSVIGIFVQALLPPALQEFSPAALLPLYVWTHAGAFLMHLRSVELLPETPRRRQSARSPGFGEIEKGCWE